MLVRAGQEWALNDVRPGREYLNDLAVLGFHHAELDAFVAACRAPSQRSSLLLRALASGLTGHTVSLPGHACQFAGVQIAAVDAQECKVHSWGSRDVAPSGVLDKHGCGFAELLDVYRAAVLKVQQDLRRMPTASLASMRHSLHEFKARLNPHSCMLALNGGHDRGTPKLLRSLRGGIQPLHAPPRMLHGISVSCCWHPPVLLSWQHAER